MGTFGSSETKTVELLRGYVDENGVAHRFVTLRAPGVEAEVRADGEMGRLAASSSEVDRMVSVSDTLRSLAMVRECIVQWEGITIVTLDHLRSLSRSDAARLVSAFYELEDADAKAAQEILAGKPEVDTEPSSEP